MIYNKPLLFWGPKVSSRSWLKSSLILLQFGGITLQRCQSRARTIIVLSKELIWCWFKHQSNCILKNVDVGFFLVFLLICCRVSAIDCFCFSWYIVVHSYNMSQHLPSSIYFPRIHQMSQFLRFSLFKEKIYLEVDYYSPYQPSFETFFFSFNDGFVHRSSSHPYSSRIIETDSIKL